MKTFYTRVVFLSLIVAAAAVLQSSAPPEEKDEKAKNLKVLPKNMNEDDLHAVMRVYSKSLGVRCNHCHAQSKTDPKKLDFASDEKHEKETARAMIKMTDRINKKYLSDHKGMKLDKIGCVTCHRGNIHPMTSVDSLPQAPK